PAPRENVLGILEKPIDRGIWWPERGSNDDRGRETGLTAGRRRGGRRGPGVLPSGRCSGREQGTRRGQDHCRQRRADRATGTFARQGGSQGVTSTSERPESAGASPAAGHSLPG